MAAKCDGFLNKLQTNVNSAWKQIHSVGENGIVFILVRFDDITSDYRDTYRTQLTEFCRNQRNLVIKSLTGGRTGLLVDRAAAG